MNREPVDAHSWMQECLKTLENRGVYRKFRKIADTPS